MDQNLRSITKKIDLSKSPTIIVSNMNCGECVKYFTTNKNLRCQIVFVLQNESLLEIRRILDVFQVKAKYIYFTTCEYIVKYKKVFCATQSPSMIYKKNEDFVLVDYQKLDSLTYGFSDKNYTFTKKLAVKN